MQCVVLAGGLATRMLPATEQVPKLLLDVAGRPFADRQVQWLEAQGVDDVVYCIGHLGGHVRDHFDHRRSTGAAAPRIRFVDEGDDRRGTAGALRLAIDGGVLNERFFVLYGDSYLDISLPAVWSAFLASGRPALMTVYRNAGRWDRSNVVYRDGLVLRYDKTEKDPEAAGMQHIDYGLLAFERAKIAELVPSGARADLADVQRDLSAAGQLAGFEATHRFFEIGSPTGLAELEAHLAR